PADGPQAHVEIELLPERDVQRANALPYGRRERAFDADEVLPIRLDRRLREPVVELLLCLLAREHLVPGDLLLAGVGFFHRRIEHRDGGVPDVRPSSVSLDEGKDGMVGHREVSGGGHRDGIPRYRGGESRHEGTSVYGGKRTVAEGFA